MLSRPQEIQSVVGAKILGADCQIVATVYLLRIDSECLLAAHAGRYQAHLKALGLQSQLWERMPATLIKHDDDTRPLDT